MRKYVYSLFFVAVNVIALAVLTACDSDNEGAKETSKKVVNPQKVFTAGIPKSYNGYQISVNGAGLVTGMQRSDGTKVTFQYAESVGTRAAGVSDYDVLMVVDYGDGEVMNCYLTLNKDGFVSHCDEQVVYKGETERETWDFTYNAAGQLLRMVRSEGGKESTEITYSNGDIVEVKTTSKQEPDEHSHYKINYVSDKVDVAIENKGGIMLFDNTLGIDMDEMIYAYYAGMLGTATRHLPVSCFDVEENFTDVFTWKLNGNGLPVSLSFSDTPDELTFEW